MKILLRSDYTWHDAEWNHILKCFIVKGTTDSINETQIVSVKDDKRDKYVICSNCGQTILNTPAAIKAHQQLSESSKTCLSCTACRQRQTKELDKKYIENSDGTYDITTKQNAKLYCSYSYWHSDKDINSEDARKICRYNGCKTATMDVWKDIFSEYPGIFDDILTVDVLVKKKWEFVGRDGNGRNTFKIPMKFNFYAEVNEYGFIDQFYYTYRNSRYYFIYSPKYSKIIWVRYNQYRKEKPNEISDTVMEKIIKKVTELYKEADKNE